MSESYILIKTNGETEIVEIDKERFLDTCYELIKCECIEICKPNFPKGDHVIRFIIDESGKLNDSKYNPLATALYNRPDILFGNVLVGKIGINRYGEMDIVGLECYEADELEDVIYNVAKQLKDVGLL